MGIFLYGDFLHWDFFIWGLFEISVFLSQRSGIYTDSEFKSWVQDFSPVSGDFHLWALFGYFLPGSGFIPFGSKYLYFFLTPTLSGFEILNNATLINNNRLLSGFL